MKIENISNTHFRAKLIYNPNIGKKDIYPNYFQERISFVKINPKNDKDIKALEQAVGTWLYDRFGANVLYATRACRNGSEYYKNHSTYALSSQKSDFDNLDGNKILGLVHTSPENGNTTFIEHIQANPEMIYQKVPEYKGIGTAILNSLKEFSSRIRCYPSKEESVINFYLRNDFVRSKDFFNEYTWQKPSY